MRTLWVFAAPAEGEALGPVDPATGDRLALGVGKAAAAHALSVALTREAATRVVAVGVAGAHRGSGLRVGQACVVRGDAFVDEGVAHPGGFLDLAALGLADPTPLVADPDAVQHAAQCLGAPVVGSTTVSTCSGTDALARERAERCPDAAIETMEGAAIALVCAKLGVPWVAIRTISNFTGDRDRAGWDLRAALETLARACTRLRAAGW